MIDKNDAYMHISLQKPLNVRKMYSQFCFQKRLGCITVFLQSFIMMKSKFSKPEKVLEECLTTGKI